LSDLTNLLSNPPHSLEYTIQSSELGYIPQDPLLVGDSGAETVSEERAEAIAKVVDLLEGEPEVVRVWTNLAE
jgi:transcriptional/translational regulatory protein YebC/TACO1